MKAKIRLGELLIAKNLVTKEQIDEALRLQVSGERRLGYLLIKMGLINEEELLKVLAEQLELPIINVDDEFSPDVKKLIPRYICRKYNVLPLRTEKNNIVSLAMADPLDDEAIDNVENYTGMVVKPSLTAYKNISKAIKQYIPFTFSEIFHFLTLNGVVKVVSVVAVVMLCTTSIFLANYVYHERYGTTSRSGDSIVYKNHDLMLELNQSGKISLLGRAARSEGHYAVTFEKIDMLKIFLERKKTDFSEKQADWLQWILKNRIEKNATSHG